MNINFDYSKLFHTGLKLDYNVRLNLDASLNVSSFPLENVLIAIVLAYSHVTYFTLKAPVTLAG
jgi:hypothetical protein